MFFRRARFSDLVRVGRGRSYALADAATAIGRASRRLGVLPLPLAIPQPQAGAAVSFHAVEPSFDD